MPNGNSSPQSSKPGRNKHRRSSRTTLPAPGAPTKVVVWPPKSMNNGASRENKTRPQVAHRTRRDTMQLGMIGLGRMGANMVRRLMKNGHQCVVYDVNPATADALGKEGATPGHTLDEFLSKLTKPRAVWLMIPAGYVDKMLADVVPKLEKNDILIDGGNSYYIDDIRRSQDLAKRGIRYVDVGTSGGVWGLERGYCMMIGGPKDAVAHLDPVFKSLAPGVGDIPRTPGREKLGGTSELGYLHCGESGAGHFVKMVRSERVVEGK